MKFAEGTNTRRGVRASATSESTLPTPPFFLFFFSFDRQKNRVNGQRPEGRF